MFKINAIKHKRKTKWLHVAFGNVFRRSVFDPFRVADVRLFSFLFLLKPFRLPITPEGLNTKQSTTDYFNKSATKWLDVLMGEVERGSVFDRFRLPITPEGLNNNKKHQQ